MAVGDIKGARRRQKLAAQKGHMPRKASYSIGIAIQREKEKAARMAKANRGK